MRRGLRRAELPVVLERLPQRVSGTSRNCRTRLAQRNLQQIRVRKDRVAIRVEIIVSNADTSLRQPALPILAKPLRPAVASLPVPNVQAATDFMPIRLVLSNQLLPRLARAQSEDTTRICHCHSSLNFPNPSTECAEAHSEHPYS